MKKIGCILMVCMGAVMQLQAVDHITLTLQKTIEMACDSSLEAFRIRHAYWVDSWQYTVYKANRLPSLSLDITPGQYNSNIVKRYDSGSDMDVYRPQRSFEARGGLAVRQNFDLLGGSFFLHSDLAYIRNFGDRTYTQFTAIPVRIGYQQSLIGFNGFKWDRKIEPLKFEKAKKQLIYNIESISAKASMYFFQLAMAGEEYRLAEEMVSNMDTLYAIAVEKAKIVAISPTDLKTLKLDRINALNSLENAKVRLEKARFDIASFLNINKNMKVDVVLPGQPEAFTIPVDRALKEAEANNPDLMRYKQSVLEQQRIVDRTRKESRMNASLNVSVGFNQAASKLPEVYRHLMRQDIVSLSLSIPLVDWGVRKGEYHIARNNLNIAEISARQGEESLREDVTMTLADFEIQKKGMLSRKEAMELSDEVYAQEMQRFILGTADLNTLTLAQQRVQNARKNYISSLSNYWNTYFKIRMLTLYDFERDLPLNYLIDDKL